MIGAVIRFVVSALVLLFVGFLVPGFRVGGFIGALIAAVVISIPVTLSKAFLAGKFHPKDADWSAFSPRRSSFI